MNNLPVSKIQDLEADLYNACNLFQWNKRLYTIYGIYPRNCNSFIHIAICIYLTVYFILICSDLPRNWGANNDTIDCLIWSSTIFMVLSRFVSHGLKRQNIVELLEEISSDYTIENFETESEIRILINYIFKAKLYFQLIVPLAYISTASYFFRNFLIYSNDTYALKEFSGPDDLLPHRITTRYLMYNKNYLSLYFCSLPIIFLCAFGLLADSAIMMAFITHVCGQLSILSRCKVKELTDDPVEFRQKLKNIVVQHNRLVSLVQKIDSAFNPSLLQQMLNSHFYICTVGYCVIFNWEQQEIKVLLVFLSCLVSTISFILAYCYFGQCLIDESNKICDALYNNNWYELQPRDMKYYIILINRTQRPLVLTGSKLYVYSHDTFITAMKAGLAYLSVLRAMYEL